MTDEEILNRIALAIGHVGPNNSSVLARVDHGNCSDNAPSYKGFTWTVVVKYHHAKATGHGPSLRKAIVRMMGEVKSQPLPLDVHTDLQKICAELGL